MSRHRRSGRRLRRKDLLAEIERLSLLLREARQEASSLRREVAAPGSEDDTVFIPAIKLWQTEDVPLITPDGRRTTVRTGRTPPSWARRD